MKKPKQAAELASPDDLPLAPALEELAFIRKALHDAVAHYAARIDGELNEVRGTLAGLASLKKVPADRARSLRDLLLILREVEVKPEKGRRRDLKRIESAAKDMRRIVESWA